MKNYLFKALFITNLFLVTNCSSNDNVNNSTPSSTSPKVFLNLNFSPTKPYFSTNGSMTSPVTESQATTIANTIDITFIYNYDYTEPGFFDPVARSSQTWYWQDYYKSWLSSSVQTIYYKTNLIKVDFDAAVVDESKIADCFNNANTIIAPHSIFPTGSCIGGRQSYDPTSILLSKNTVFAFKNMTSGRRGLIYIRNDQSAGWPIAFVDSNTKVDIVREN